MSFEMQTLAFDKVVSSLARDEVLIVSAGIGENDSPVLKKLASLVNPFLNKRFYHLETQAGILPSGQPFLLTRWFDHEKQAFEYRWMAQFILKRLKFMFTFEKIAWFSAGSATALERVLAQDLYTSGQKEFSLASKGLQNLRFISSQQLEKSEVQKTQLNYCQSFRDWVNESADNMTSLAIGERLQSFCSQSGCELDILDEQRLLDEKMHLLLKVGQASHQSPARCYVVRYQGRKKSKPLMLMGKGITYDTGGINLKPYESYVNAMHNDMGGAALMANIFMALVEASFDFPLILVIPCCENLIGEKAMKPGTRLSGGNGKSVFVEHTDAEGRLVLADALSYCHRQFTPFLTLVAATLTTASLRQFSNYYTPVHFANSRFKSALEDSGNQWGELFTFWDQLLPFKMANESRAGDLTNLGRLPAHASASSGSNVAAHFLQEFSRHPLVHFDIFASTWNWSGDYPGSQFGATGAPFNSLFSTLLGCDDSLWNYAST